MFCVHKGTDSELLTLSCGLISNAAHLSVGTRVHALLVFFLQCGSWPRGSHPFAVIAFSLVFLVFVVGDLIPTVGFINRGQFALSFVQ